MKRYVKEFANDILNSDKKNKLMKQEYKDEHRRIVESVLDDYKAGLIGSSEAMYVLSKMVCGY